MSVFTTTRYLMCSPDEYRVEYVINPWMQNGKGRVNPKRATDQWRYLKHSLVTALGCGLNIIRPSAGLRDMVFTANAGLVIDGIFVPSRFRHSERALEEPHFLQWASDVGYRICEMPTGVSFEGAGDALFDRRQPILWLGYGFRTDPDAADYLSRFSCLSNIQVQPLHINDPRYYHLDTCFCPLEGGFLLYYPPAFSPESLSTIESNYPERSLIRVGDEDARDFACNAVNAVNVVVLNRATPELKAALGEKGFRCVETPLDEFILAGGSAKCLTLRMDEPVRR